MKKQHLAILGAVLVVLLVARFALHRSGTSVATDLADAGVTRVLPATVDGAAVTWVQVTSPAPAGGSAPAPLRFERRDGAWVVASRAGVPADGDAVFEFVSKACALSGEVRGEGETSWPSFGLGADAATKVELGIEPGSAAGTIWIGKQGDDPDAHFARAEGAPQVRHVQDGLRGALGLWGPGAAPQGDLWLKKDVVAVKGSEATRFVVDRQDMRLVLEKRESPAPAPASAPDGASAPVAPASSWVVAEPSLSWTVKADGLESVVDRAGQVRVSGALDATSAACSSEPSATVTFTRSGGGDVVVRLRGAVEGKDELALTIDGQPHCWSLGSWSATSLLARASSIWDVPQAFPEAPAGDASRVRLERAGKTSVATRGSDGTWKIASGEGDATRLSGIASTLRSLRLDDVAESAKVPAPSLAVTATVSADIEGKALTLRILGDRAGAPGERYARIEGGTKLPDGWLLVLPKSTAASLLP